MRSFDIHQHITNQILAMLDQPRGEFQLPWHVPGGTMRPRNAVTGKAYQGINILVLWAAAERACYASGTWATYRQWASLGAQVRKGEKSSYIVFYKQAGAGQDDGNDPSADAGATGPSPGTRLVTRASAVFAAEQVDGYEPPSAKPADPVHAIDHAEAFIGATRAVIEHEGHRAFYRLQTDTIYLPVPSAFLGSMNSSATEGYYATLFHELIHWTSHKSRCDRDLGRRFRDQAYAMEELIAELGSAFLCADLQITPSARADHAQYIASWLQALRSDKKAIFTAASKASQAAAFLHALQPSPTTHWTDEKHELSRLVVGTTDRVEPLLPSSIRSTCAGATA